MRRANEWRRRLLGGALALVTAMGIFAVGFCGTPLTGHAAGQAKVTAPNGAKIRESADTASTMVGGAEKDKTIPVLGQTQGADGYTWYQVQVNDTTTGYVRADLVEVSGDIPAVGAGGETGGEGEGGGESAPPVEVTQVNPVNANVSGDNVEIRDTASLSGQVLGTVPGDTVVTVTGYLTDAENITWYQVSYISGETQVSGFLISDNCELSEDLTPMGQEPPEAPEPAEPAPTQEPSPYELVENNGRWLIVDNVNDPGNGYPVDELFANVQKNAQAYRDSEVKVKNQKIIIIVLVFLLVGAVAGIAFLVFKVREMSDSAYFNEVENETLRRRNASGGQGKSAREAGGQKAPMHTVGPEKQSARPVRQAEGGQRPGPAQRPGSQGQRPAGGTQGQRPAGVQGARRPEGAPGRAPQGARPGQSPQKAQPKNFMADDDEFDFEFLNYDGKDE